MRIAIVGATGMVGLTFLKLLEKRKFPVEELRLFGSKNKGGRKIFFRSKNLPVTSLKEESFNGLDLAFFSAGEEVSLTWSPKAVARGCTVIDNSAAFRMQEGIPLVVPEVNAQEIKKGIVANPNCSTIQLVVCLQALQSCFGLKSVHVSSYQSLSGAGRSAVEFLKKQSAEILKEPNKLSPENHEPPLAFNCIPQIGSLNEEGFTTEEWKLMTETKKILGLPHLKITATAVRVPCFNGHGEAVVVTLEKNCNKEELLHAFSRSKGLKVQDESGHYPHQRFVDGKDEVYVGRIRQVPGEAGKSWMMWIAADNIRKGAALNSLQIAEKLL